MNWSELPIEVLTMIARKLTEITDLLRFRSVCSSWRSSSKSITMPPQFPWLILPSNNSSTNHCFYSFSEDRIYTINLPVPRDSFIFGSSYGRLLILNCEEKWISAKLIDPFNGFSLKRLPSLSTSSFSPTNIAWDYSTSVIMVACTTKAGLFYYRPYENWFWSQIESMRNIFVRRIIHHLGHFYVLERDSYRTKIINAETLGVVGVISSPEFEFLPPTKIHLTVSSQKLMLLLEDDYCRSEKYKVFELESCFGEVPKWIEVRNLGELSFFVDDVHCFSFGAESCKGLRKNCIYQVQSKEAASFKIFFIWVFNMVNNNYEELDCRLNSFSIPDSSQHFSPSWILPTLC